MACTVNKKAFCLGICQNWVNCDGATEVSVYVPHRTTYGQNNSWVVHEIPAEWLPVRCETKRPAGAIGRDCRACARNVCQEPSEVNISSTCKVGQKLGVSLPLLTCSPSTWPSRLLYRRGRKSRRDLWITLYFSEDIICKSLYNIPLFVLHKCQRSSDCYLWKFVEP